MKKIFTLLFAACVVSMMNAEVLTVAQAYEIGMALDSMATSETEYSVEGYVINAGSFNVVTKNQSWYMADVTDATAPNFWAYNCYPIEGTDTLKVINGDKVRLLGKLTKYWDRSKNKFIIEIKNGNASFISKVEGEHDVLHSIEEITVAQALKIGHALSANASTENLYTIRGYVSAVDVKSSDAYSELYNNQSFWITDKKGTTASTYVDGAFYVYHGKPSTDKAIPYGAYVEFTCAIKRYIPNGVSDPDIDNIIENTEQNIPINVQEEPAGPKLPEGVISCDSAVALAASFEDPIEVKATITGPEVKVRGYVTYAYNASERNGVVMQSVWIASTEDGNPVIQGAYLEIAGLEAAVKKGDYVQLEGTLAKYLKEGKDGKPNEIIIQIFDGMMLKGPNFTKILVYPLGGGSVALTDNVLTATPNYGYHFVQWNDGVTDNPRTVTITQDTTFTAEFAKNEYTITTVSSNNEWGTTAGDTTTLYEEQVEISAKAIQYGYHFDHWSDYDYLNGDYYRSNPRIVTITADATYEAIFAKDVFSITKIADSEQGSISGFSVAEHLDNVTLEAIPNEGYHFKKWSDGITDNPRTFVITQDTTFRADFELDRTGACGTDLALTWTYEPEEKVLTISGNGAFNENMQCGVEARAALQKIVFADGVTSIGESAFANCATMQTLVLSKDVKKINENAFYNCENLTAIYNYRPTPTNIYANTFSGVDKFDCILYVPEGSVDMYKSDGSNWKDFYFIETMASTGDEYTVTYIGKDEEILDSEKIKLHLPEAPEIVGFTFLGWRPVFSFIESKVIVIEAVYEADEPTSAPEVYTNPVNPAQKLIRNGNVYILTSDKTYTVTGQAVK